MESERKTAIALGVCFLTAMTASLVGSGMIEIHLTNPDFMKTVSIDRMPIIIGTILEFINSFSVIGIGIMMFPVIKKQNESLALGYTLFRGIEAIFYTAGAIIPLVIMSLSSDFLNAGAPGSSHFQTAAVLLMEIRALENSLLLPVFFCFGALLLYIFLYKSNRLPRFLSVWGFIGIAGIMILNLFNMNFIFNMILALPIILNEIFMGIWLIVKGFSHSADTDRDHTL